MSTVTFRDDDSPGTRLIRHEEQLRIEHPHLTPRHARQLVAEQHPDLVQLHNQGWPELEPPAPTVDPSIALKARVHELLKSREALNRSQALELACRQLPEHAEAYRSGLRMPAPTSTMEHSAAEPHVTRRSSDPGMEVLRLIGEAMQADRGLTHAQAQKAVLAADPVLAKAYVQGMPLPMATETPRPRSEQLVEAALAQVQKLRRELAQLTAPAERHYKHLSPAEQDRQPLRRGTQRRIRPGETLRPGETRLEKMSPAAAGGGSFAEMGV